MYEKIRITENSLQVLALFTHDFKSEYYIREVERLVKISPRTAQLILEDLEEKGILESKLRGKIKTYKINGSNFTQRYLVFVEQYKAITFLEKRLLLKEAIEKINPHIKGIGLIFGSYVKKLKKVSRNLGIEISVKCYPIKLFERKWNKDFLLKEIEKDHVIFTGTEMFIEKVFKNG